MNNGFSTFRIAFAFIATGAIIVSNFFQTGGTRIGRHTVDEIGGARAVLVTAANADDAILAVTDKSGKLPYPAGTGLQVTQGTNSTPSHNGSATRYDIDLDTPNNSDEVVLAPIEGPAYTHFDTDDFGNHVAIDAGPADPSNPNGPRHFWVICHLRTFLVKNGQTVKQGQPIAMEGCTGLCTGDHIHFGLHSGNPQLNAASSTSVDNALIRSRNATAGDSSFSWRRTTQFATGSWYESDNSYPASTLTNVDWIFANHSDSWHLGSNGGATTIGFNSPNAWVIQAGSDPQIISPFLNRQASEFNRIEITLASLASDTLIAIYFATESSPNFSDSKKFTGTIVSGGGYHTITVPLTGNSQWNGRITRLRVDPVGNGNGQAVGIQRIRLLGDGGGGGSCTATTIASGQTLNGTLSTSDCVLANGRNYDKYTFNGSQGDQIAISQTSTAFDTFVYLRDGSGNLLAQDDNSGPTTSSRIPGTSGFFTLPASGAYVIEASSASSGLTGSYTIALNACTFDLSSYDKQVGPSAGATSISMDTLSGCNWTATSDASWLTLRTPSGTGDGSITYDYEVNNSALPRVGHITAGGLVHTVTQTGVGSAGNVSFAVSAYSAGEGSGLATVTVRRLGGTGTGIVNYETIPGTASAGSDYTHTSGTAIFVSDTTTYTFDVPILEDAAAEGSETIQLRLFNPSLSVTMGTPTTATITIVDNDTSQPAADAPYDFDGDGKTDLSIFRPNGGEWWYQRSSNNSVVAAQFGLSTDKVVAADYTGDGRSDIAVWRPSSGQWFILRSEDSSFYGLPFGAVGDVPSQADFDADGKADVAVFRPSNGTWYVLRSSDGQVTIAQFGANGDSPVAADYDGDGRADMAIARTGLNGIEWWIQRSQAGTVVYQFGVAGDKTVAGDYTGDGKTDVAIWRPSTGYWYVLRSSDSSFFAFPWGQPGDMPAPGDYDGDGVIDAAIMRPSAGGVWYVNRSSGGVTIQHFGSSTDQPVPGATVR